MDRSGAARTEIEKAVNTVRSVLAALAAVTVLGAGPANGRGILEAALAAVGIAVAAAFVATAGRRILTQPPIQGRRAVVLHLLDVAFFVALAGALETYVDDAAWALLVVPMVLASLRFDDLAVLATWLLGAVGYGLVGAAGWLGTTVGIQTLAGRIGILLAVAAGITVLARWLQEAWQNQADLTAAAELRTKRIASIESAARAMRSASQPQIIEISTAFIPELGFETGTAMKDGEIIAATGREQLVPVDPDESGLAADEIRVTRWRSDRPGLMYSASTLEPFSGVTIAGWQSDPIDPAAARALHDLTSNVTVAMEGAHHLEQILHQATHDPLTNLANRAAFQQRLTECARRAEPIAVLYIDLDQFKAINDAHGHHVGDRVLIVVGHRLRRAVGRHGLAARLGGDEFAILLTGEAVRYTAQFRDDLALILGDDAAVEGLRLKMGASVGAATVMGPVDATSLLKAADRAAYEVKAARRAGLTSPSLGRDDDAQRPPPAPVHAAIGPNGPSPGGSSPPIRRQ